MAGPLAGINVLEFSQVIAGPFGGQALADLGANVLKVEPPEGDSWRLQLNFAPKESKTFQCLNRGKDSLTLSLDQPAAQEIVHQLVPDMDVVLINYRPDVPKKFRIDYETLSSIRPDLIYVDLTAFGRQGPWALRPGYDGAVQAVSGLMAAEGKTRPEEGSPMTISSTAVADFCSGLAMADAVVTALYHRQQTGDGQMVQCSLLATALNLQLPTIMEHGQADGQRNDLRQQRLKRAGEGASFKELIDIRSQSLSHETSYHYRAFLTSDGAIVIAAETDLEKESLRQVFDLSAPPTEAEVEQMVRDIARSKGSAVMEKLKQYRIPTGPVQYPEELINDDMVVDNRWVFDLHHDITGAQAQMKLNLNFSGTPLTEPKASPPLGRDTERVLAGLGYDAEAVAKLRSEGVVF